MSKNEAILLVDDNTGFMQIVQEILGTRYTVYTAPNGSAGIAAVKKYDAIDVVIADYALPGMNGLDFLAEVKRISPGMVRMMLTSTIDSDVLIKAINKCGIFKFLKKPCAFEEIWQAIQEAIKYRKDANQNSKTGEVAQPLITAMSERYPYGAGHLDRTVELCYLMGLEMGLSRQQLINLEYLAQLQDIGYLVMPESILFKEAPLTSHEWDIMRQHPIKGYQIAASSTTISNIAELILCHHERWDGNGYPLRLKGKEIPLECRILHVANAYNAMLHDRPYRQALTRERVLGEIKHGSGTQFDPQIVELFLTLILEGHAQRGF